LPKYEQSGDAGLSMHCLQGKILQPGERWRFDCGWALEFDPGFVAIVFDRGSLGVVKGLKQMGGIFDSNYRGEYNVCLVNLSDRPYEVSQGDKVAQLILLPCATAIMKEVEELLGSNRGDKSFGSTGR